MTKPVLKRGGSLPFRVARQTGCSLIAQVCEGLRHAIVSGHYRPGDFLPSQMDVAAELGVSEIIIRRAVTRLKEEGLVAPRPRHGMEVCAPGEHIWRGHVLYAHWSGADMYYHSVLSAEVAERLHDARYLVTDLNLSGSEKQRGFPAFKTILATRSVTLALVEGSADCLEELLGHEHLPFVHLDYAQRSAHAIAFIHSIHDSGYRAMADYCRTREIRTVAAFLPCTPDRSLLDSLSASGMVCQVRVVAPVPGYAASEAVERGGLAAMRDWLCHHRKLPELIYLGDDVLARGALLALTERNLRIPEDVQVITWANRGMGPVYGKPLTRIEMDPCRHGALVADCLLAVLGQRPPAGPVCLEPTFLVGQTTVG